jgi:hypothetical protein
LATFQGTGGDPPLQAQPPTERAGNLQKRSCTIARQPPVSAVGYEGWANLDAILGEPISGSHLNPTKTYNMGFMNYAFYITLPRDLLFLTVAVGSPGRLTMKNVFRAARKKLGYAKYVVLEGGHREVRYRWRINRLDRWASRSLERLGHSGTITPIETPAVSDIELHTMCGHNCVTMGLWSLWSFLRWAEGRVAVVVHSDGSITPGDIERFQGVFTHVRFVGLEEARGWANRRLAGVEFEQMRAFLGSQFGLKLIAPHMSEESHTIVMMDTDILFLERPDEVLDICFGDRTDRRLVSFRDDFDWLPVIAPPNHFRERCGDCELKFNAGFVVMPRFGDEQFRFLERMLRAYEPAWRDHYFAEQALLALTAGHYGWNGLPHPQYRIDDKSGSTDAVAIHYVSNKVIRPRFYTDGLVKLIRVLEGTANSISTGLRNSNKNGASYAASEP